MPDKQIIVTGASKGIGAAIAIELDRRGHNVVCLSRSGDAPVGVGLVCDMTDEESVKTVIAEVAAGGSVSGLVNNAGVHLGGPTAKLETADYESVMRLNATAILVASREAYPHLKNSGGSIINLGSFFDKMGVPDSLAYCASKAAVAAMTRCMAVEWAADGIAVVNVAPGYIETDLNRDFLSREKVRKWMASRVPVGRPGTPEEVARFVAAILGEKIPYLTGETVYLDGGHGMNH